MENPVYRSVTDPDFILQYRPDSDRKHGHFKLSGEFQQAWVRGNESNNGGDMTRLYFLFQNLSAIVENKIPGAVAELGVWKGNSAYVLHKMMPERRIYLFDTFNGFDKRDRQAETHRLPVSEGAFCDTSLQSVQRFLGTDKNIIYAPGWFPETSFIVPDDEIFSFVHIDCDLGKPVSSALEYFYPRTAPGGMIVIHDYSSGWWKDVKPAVDNFLKDKPENPVLIPDKSGTVAITRNKKLAL